MANPRPTPTRLKILNGNPGQRKINKKDPSLRMRSAIPAKPQLLRDKRAKDEWTRITDMLRGAGIITEVDQKILLMYCNTFSLYREAELDIIKNGMYTTYDSGPKTNPAVTILHKTRTDIIRMLIEMGLTPSARSRIIALDEGDNPKESLESFLDVG